MLFLCVPLAGYSPWGHKESDTTERLITHAYWVISPCYKLFIEMTSDICAKLLQSCPTLCDPMDYSLPGSSVHGIFPGKNMGVDCYFLLQGIVLTQGSNPHLQHHRREFFTTEPPEAMEMNNTEICALGIHSLGREGRRAHEEIISVQGSEC